MFRTSVLITLHKDKCYKTETDQTDYKYLEEAKLQDRN